MPRVEILEELAPGRTLVQIVGGTHDGVQVVVMGDRRHPAARALEWYLDGDEPPEGLRATVPGDRPPPRAPGAPSDAPSRANELLESLLSPPQLAEWRRHHRFWVPTPYGSVQLGWLFHLDFRPEGNGRPLVLCVVPVEPHRSRMPLPDVWVNLLLVLQADPRHFFGVANWRDAEGGSWRPGPVPVHQDPPPEPRPAGVARRARPAQAGRGG